MKFSLNAQIYIVSRELVGGVVIRLMGGGKNGVRTERGRRRGGY